MPDDGDVKVIKIVLQFTFEKESGTIPPMVMKDLEALRDVIVTHLDGEMSKMDFLTIAAERGVIRDEDVQRLWDLWLKWLGEMK